LAAVVITTGHSFFQQSFWTWTGWTAVTAVATCMLVLGVGAAVWAIRDARRATQLAAASDVFREYRSVELRDARRRIRDLPRFDPSGRPGLDQLSVEDRRSVELVSNFLDDVGTLVAQNLLRPEPAAAFLGGSAQAVWSKLAPYVYDERHKIGRETYQRHFEDLVYRLNRLPFSERIDKLGRVLPADAEVRQEAKAATSSQSATHAGSSEPLP
jgi:hypothetical protein